MKKVLFILLFTNLILFDINNTILAQNDFSYKDRGNRFEGIVEYFELVAGEKMVLISSIIENNEIKSEKLPEKYNLGFYISEDASLNIEVKEIEKLYRMIPKQKNYKAGFITFPWPSQIPHHYQISLKQLCPLAKIYQPGMTTVVPIVLFEQTPQIDHLTYNFAFIPLRTIETLNYKIKRLKTDRSVFEKRIRDLPMDEVFHVTWDGRDNRNIPQSSDWYYIYIEAEFEPLFGSNDKPKKVFLNYKFYHYSELLTSNLFQK